MVWVRPSIWRLGATWATGEDGRPRLLLPMFLRLAPVVPPPPLAEDGGPPPFAGDRSRPEPYFRRRRPGGAPGLRRQFPIRFELTDGPRFSLCGQVAALSILASPCAASLKVLNNPQNHRYSETASASAAVNSTTAATIPTGLNQADGEEERNLGQHGCARVAS